MAILRVYENYLLIEDCNTRIMLDPSKIIAILLLDIDIYDKTIKQKPAPGLKDKPHVDAVVVYRDRREKLSLIYTLLLEFKGSIGALKSPDIFEKFSTTRTALSGKDAEKRKGNLQLIRSIYGESMKVLNILIVNKGDFSKHVNLIDLLRRAALLKLRALPLHICLSNIGLVDKCILCEEKSKCIKLP